MTSESAGFLTQCFKFARLIYHLVIGLAKAGLVLPRMDQAERTATVRRWSRDLLAILHVKLRVAGSPPAALSSNTMLVANHTSWLDIFALLAVCPARFVSKAEVRSWPVIGWLCAKAGTLFIERAKRLDTARINQSIREVFNAGECVGVFPEGTTSDGTALRHFHASLLQPAALAGAELHPVGIRYRKADGSINTAPAYIGQMGFTGSLRKILAQQEIHAELVFTKPVSSEGKNRRELARIAEQAIAGALGLPAPHTEYGKASGLPSAGKTDFPPINSPYRVR